MQFPEVIEGSSGSDDKLTDKQAAATFKTNDLFSDLDQENELENFILDQKILSSGIMTPNGMK